MTTARRRVLLVDGCAFCLALRDVVQTPAGEVIVMPGSGRTALEAGAVSIIEPDEIDRAQT